MTNLYLKHPRVLQHVTRIEQVRAQPDGLWIELAENIVRPEGGGQPRDHASVTSADGTFHVTDVRKRAGATWLRLDGTAVLAPGETITVEVDAMRRTRMSRNHSLTHVLMASFRQITVGFQSRGASISESGDTVQVCFDASALGPDEVLAAQALAARTVTAGAKIEIVQVRSLSQARVMFPYFRVDPDLNLSGRVRVVHIFGLDANPCSGSHAADIAEIGDFGITGVTNDGGMAVVKARLANA